jgi:hypothetical protein
MPANEVHPVIHPLKSSPPDFGTSTLGLISDLREFTSCFSAPCSLCRGKETRAIKVRMHL